MPSLCWDLKGILLLGGPQEPYEEQDEDDYKLEPSKGQADRGQARILEWTPGYLQGQQGCAA